MSTGETASADLGAGAGDQRTSPQSPTGARSLMARLVQPSIEEGYGLPVSEALAAGVPAASSAAGGLEEAAGGQAEMFDPYDEHAMSAAIDRAASSDDPVLAQGRSPAEFAWEVLEVVFAGERDLM